MFFLVQRREGKGREGRGVRGLTCRRPSAVGRIVFVCMARVCCGGQSTAYGNVLGKGSTPLEASPGGRESGGFHPSCASAVGGSHVTSYLVCPPLVLSSPRD